MKIHNKKSHPTCQRDESTSLVPQRVKVLSSTSACEKVMGENIFLTIMIAVLSFGSS